MSNLQLISLIYGGSFILFRPRTASYGHEEYGLENLEQKFRDCDPFPAKYEEIASPGWADGKGAVGG